jgi:hypothetical protein
MGKNNAEKLKRDLAKELEDVCLHCAFFKMHSDKWMGWEPGVDNDPAFNDLVRSAVKIVAEIFTMLSEGDQMHFLNRVMQTKELHEKGPVKSIEDVFELIKTALNARANRGGPVKH